MGQIWCDRQCDSDTSEPRRLCSLFNLTIVNCQVDPIKVFFYFREVVFERVTKTQLNLPPWNCWQTSLARGKDRSSFTERGSCIICINTLQSHRGTGTTNQQHHNQPLQVTQMTSSISCLGMTLYFFVTQVNWVLDK